MIISSTYGYALGYTQHGTGFRRVIIQCIALGCWKSGLWSGEQSEPAPVTLHHWRAQGTLKTPPRVISIASWPLPVLSVSLRSASRFDDSLSGQ